MINEILMMIATGLSGGDNATIDNYVMQKQVVGKPAVYANVMDDKTTNVANIDAEDLIDKIQDQYNDMKELYEDSFTDDLALETNDARKLARKYVEGKKIFDDVKNEIKGNVVYEGNEKKELSNLMDKTKKVMNDYQNILTAFWNDCKDDIKIAFAIQYKSKDQHKHSQVQRNACGFDYEMKLTKDYKLTDVLKVLFKDFEKKEFDYAVEVMAKLQTKYRPIKKTRDRKELLKDFKNKFYKFDLGNKTKKALRKVVDKYGNFISAKGTEFTEKGIKEITDGKEDRDGEIELFAVQYFVKNEYSISDMAKHLNKKTKDVKEKEVKNKKLTEKIKKLEKKKKGTKGPEKKTNNKK